MNSRLLRLFCALFALLVTSSFADVTVKGYKKKDGTVVQPHKRTEPNKTKNDNYSTKGNVNPYTGKAGTKPRDRETSPPSLFGGGGAATPQQPMKRGRTELESAIRSSEATIDRFVKQSSFSDHTLITTEQYEAAKKRLEEAQAELKQLPTR